jgi:hypothetical protein
MEKIPIVATSIGMKRKNKNLLSQNSKLKFKLTPKLTLCAKVLSAAMVNTVNGGATKPDALHSKLMVFAVDVNHSKSMEKIPIVATSIGMQRKNKNLLSQNSKLKFKLTPKLMVCASGQIVAMQHGTITSLDAKQRKLMVFAVDVTHSK